jgi:hypothetical protein
MLLAERHPPAERGAKILGWVLEDPLLHAAAGPTDLEDVVRFLRDEMGIPVETGGIIPPGLLEIPLAFRHGVVNFAAFLAETFRMVELGFMVSGGGEGLRIVPLGERTGLDDGTIRRRLESILARWKGEGEGR